MKTGYEFSQRPSGFPPDDNDLDETVLEKLDDELMQGDEQEDLLADDIDDADIDEVDEFIVDDSELLTGEEVDEENPLDVDDLENVEQQLNLDAVHDLRLYTEISEDPVRLYLKEIGSIELLDPDQEFWLSTRLEAEHRLDLLCRKHPLVRNDQKTNIRQIEIIRVFRAIFEDLSTAWSRTVEDTRRDRKSVV